MAELRESIQWLADRAGPQDSPNREAWIKAVTEIVAAARAEGEAKMRAQWAAAVNMPTPNHDAEIAVILKGMKRPAMRLLSKQIQSLVAGVASICEAEGRRKAVEACAQIAVKCADEEMPEPYWDNAVARRMDWASACGRISTRIRALAEQPEPASKLDGLAR